MRTIERKNELRYILLIFLAICFLATGGIFVKMSTLPPINTAFYRVLFSIPFLLPFSAKQARKLTRKQGIIIIIAGIFLALDLILWNISFKYTTVANANLFANLTPFTVIPISYFIFKEKINKQFLLGAIITLLGVVVLLSGKISPNFVYTMKGDGLALLTSIFYSGFLLTVYKLRERINTNVIMLVSTIGSLAVLSIAMYFTEGFHFPKTLNELLPLVGLALISQIFGQGLLSYCLGNVNATISSIITLTQPVVAAVYSFFIFSEHLTLTEIIGIFITLTGVYYAKKIPKKRNGALEYDEN